MKIYCDGGSRGNPGPSASAFASYENEELVHKESKYLGINTNNFAEYNAVLLAIKWVTKQKAEDVEKVIVNLDSQLVERQLNGVYKIKNETLKKIFDEIKSLIEENSLKISFVWNYREKNKIADKLVNEELDKNK